MSEEKNQVLIIDDSLQDIKIVMKNLEQDYAVLVATSGAKALEMLSNGSKPDIVLLDVMMPDMDGYETCRRIKQNDNTKHIDVIFISAHDTTEEKLAGYEAGGCDYVIKPISSDEMLRKIQIAIENQKIRANLELEKNVAMETAMTAMTSSGELGVVLEFMKKSFTVDGVFGLAELMIDTLVLGYGLETSVQIRTNLGEVNYASTGPVAELEQELLRSLKNSKRIIEKNSRLILNYDDISVLINNMPGNSDARGRICDSVAMLIEGAVSRLHVNELMAGQVDKIIADTQDTLANLKQLQAVQKEQSIKIMDKVMQELEASMISLALTEEQEEALINIVQCGVDETMVNFEQGLQADEQLNQILANLQKLA